MLRQKIMPYIVKQWWIFSCEGVPLWEKVVCSIHGFDPLKSVDIQKDKMKGSTWSQIRELPKLKKEVVDIIDGDSMMKVKNGGKKNTGECFNKLFPRLFSISLQKSKCIVGMGVWDRFTWRWNFEWCRPLFTWETQLVHDLISLL